MKRPLWIIAAVAALVAAGLAFQQAANAPRELASLIPPGPLLYLEAKNFHALLGEWNSSGTKAAWLKSANYEVFSRSRLLQRLELSQREFAAAAGLPPDMNLLESAAGAQSAIALYDIGNLEFLYVTRMPADQFAATQLWKLRGTYQPRQSAGISYYVKNDAATRTTSVFAVAQGYVFLGTREDVLAGALALLAGQNTVAVNQEPWFVRTVQATGAAGELRLVMNLQRLVTTPHFRTYWIQRNNSEVRRFSAGISDLARVGGDFHEDRVFLRTAEQQPLWNENAVNQAARFAPALAGFVQGWASPTPEQVWALVHSKLLAPAPAAEASSNRAPQVNLSEGVAGSESDLEARIDLPAVDLSDPPQYEPLQRLLRSLPVDAMVQIRGTRQDGVFVRIESGVVLTAGADWDASAVRSALATALATSSSIGGTGGLDLATLKLAFSGRALLIATSQELLDAMLAAQSSALPGARYAALYRHSQELKNLTRITTLIDAPNAAAAGGAEPPFFSRNLASLGDTLSWVDSEAVTVHENAADVRETVVYRVRK
jgi:hypothetical protein